jgi:hypothetical protein
VLQCGSKVVLAWLGLEVEGVGIPLGRRRIR